MDIKFNYNDTFSTATSQDDLELDFSSKDKTLISAKDNTPFTFPTALNTNTDVNTDDVISSSTKRDIIVNIEPSEVSYVTNHTRDFYRGRSFRYAGIWTKGVHYISDEYVVDFVVKDNALLACTKSHMSSTANEPSDWVVDEKGEKYGILSEYWDLVITGVSGSPGEEGGVYLPSYDEENDRLVWTLVPSEDLESPIYVYLGINEKIQNAISSLQSKIDGLQNDINNLELITTHISSDISGINSNLASLEQRVSDNEGNIGQLWLTSKEFGVKMSDLEGNVGQLTLTAREFNVQMENLQGDVGRLWLTAQEFGVRMSNAEGDVSLLKQTADEIQTRVENAEGDISQMHQRANEIWTQVENNQGDISRISQRADQIQTQVENNAGDISRITQRADEISSQVENAQGDISQIRQTADEISTRVENNEGDISQLRQTATEISATVESNKTLADGAIAENRSLISQTAEQIRTEVASNVTRLDGEIEQNRSEIRQTAEEITATVERNKQETDGAIESAKSEFKQTADEISATVEKNKIDVDGQIESARSEIRQTAEEISSTVEANKKSVDGQIEQLSSDITQTASEIRSEVESSIADVNGNIEDAKSEINQLAGEVDLKVSQSTFDSKTGEIESSISDILVDNQGIHQSVAALSGSLDTNASAFNAYVNKTDGLIEALQNQVDGAIETWYYNGAPTLNNIPASEWTTNDDKDTHIGDLYYDKDTEYAYRFMKDNGVYSWERISDSDISTALTNASRAQATADGKMKVFVVKPTDDPNHPQPPYQSGDLWVQGSTDNKDGLVYTCVQDRAANELYKSSDWVVAFDAATKSVLKSSFDIFADAIQGKVYQEDANGIITGDTYSSVKQTVDNINLSVENVRKDLLATGIDISGVQYDDQGHVTQGGTVTITADNFILQGNKPGADRALTLVYDKDGIPRISAANLEVEGVFSTNAWSTNLQTINNSISTASSNAQSAAEATAKGYADTAETNAVSTSSTYLSNALYGEGGTAQDPKPNSVWGYINGLTNDLGDYEYLKIALENKTTALGGLLLTSLIQLGASQNGNEWTVRAGINGSLDKNLSDPTRSIAAWFGGAMKDGQITANENASDRAKTLFRMDGSGYLADRNIWWDKNGNLTVDGYILTNEIQLKDNDGNVTAGMSGAYDNSATHFGHGIASWYGGPKIDHEKDPSAASYAKSVFRMDGSGYLAGGQISWGDTGSLVIHGATLQGSNGSITTGQLVERILEIGSWFVKEPYETVDGHTRYYLRLVCGDTTNIAGLASDGFVSAGGLSNGSGTEGVNLPAVWESLTNASSDTTYNNVKFAREHLPIAGKNVLGAVKIGNGLNISNDGTLSAASGTVTSIGLSMPTGFTVTSSPITESGTIAVTFANGYSLPTTANQTAWSAKYDKPATGIPESDLAQDVKDLLDKADTALQSHQPVALYAGAKSGIKNAAQTADPYILLVANNSNKGNVQLKGAGSVTTKSDATGIITITGVNTTYKLSINDNTRGDSTNGVDLGTIYVPTSAGTENQILIANSNGAPAWADQTSITKLGTITTGTWNGSTIDVAHGGTGKTTWTQYGVVYASANTTLAQVTNVSGNSQKKYLVQTTNSSGTVQAPSWVAIAFEDIPSLYIGTTKVQSSSANQALTGITTAAFSGNVTIGGTLTVGTSSVKKDTTLNGNLSVTNKATVNSLEVTTTSVLKGATTINNTLSVTGLSTLSGGISLGTKYTPAGETTQVDSKLVWDDNNKAWHLIGNFYVDGFVSAGGVSSDSSGASGISPEGMWDLLSDSTNEQINASHLSTALTNYVNALSISGTGNYVASISKSGHTITATMATLPTSSAWSSITDKPTTISGYGITDAKFGTAGTDYVPITLGDTTKNVLTKHQSVTLASGTNNGTLKLTVNGTSTDNIKVKGLGDAAYKSIGSVASGNTGLVTGGAVYSAINDVVTSAIKFRGVTSSELSDGDTSRTIIIDNESYTANAGDLVLSDGLEFLWTGTKWQLLGDEDSYVLKTTTVNGHALSNNITITASDVGLGNVTNLAASGYFTLFEMDSTDTTKTSITIGGTNKKLVIGYATKAAQDADGNTIKSSYGASLGAASNALTLKAKDGTTLSTITAANLVTVLGNTAIGRATGDKNGNDIYATYVSGVAVGTGDNAKKLGITKNGSTTYITVPFATLSDTVTTTADTTNTLYLVGVTSSATTTLKRNTGITMKNGALTVAGLTASTNGITVTKGGITVTAGGVTINAGGLTVTGDTTLSNKVYLGDSKTYKTYDNTNGSFLEWDDTNHAWHVVGNFYADGFVSAGGLSTSGSGGGGTSVAFVDYAAIKTLSTDDAFTTATAWATHLFYQDVFGSGSSTIASRISALENSSTNVTYTASQSSGTLLGTITIDGNANKIYAPTIPTSLKNPKALTFGSKSYDGSAEKEIKAEDLSACVIGTVVGTVTITT